MIYTVTMNPAIDYFVEVKDFYEGATNRATDELVFAGGKGINVSIVLRELGSESVVTGFLAGATGRAISEMLEQYGLDENFIFLNHGNSRINVKITAGSETEINGKGPIVTDNDFERLIDKLNSLGKNDTLVLSGRMANGIENGYSRIMERLVKKDIKFILDTSEKEILTTIKYKPFLVKPNIDEIGEMFGVRLQTAEEVIPYAKILHNRGAENVIVSMGECGAVLVGCNSEVLCAKGITGKVVSTVGAGDSMVAGFLHGLSHGDLKSAFKLAVAAGTATAFSAGIAKKQKIAEILNCVEVTVQ
ncbi:MAG: 1-phosphofructokinase [Oscillospiraceae bacterium]